MVLTSKRALRIASRGQVKEKMLAATFYVYDLPPLCSVCVRNDREITLSKRKATGSYVTAYIVTRDPPPSPS
jgi:hypothetical protein